MTDEIAGSAPAPAEPSDIAQAPLDTPAIAEPSSPEHVGTGDKDAAPKSLKDSIRDAFAKVEKGDTETPQQAADRARDEKGRFAKQEADAAAAAKADPAAAKPQPADADQPPARFSPDAKAAWAQAPAPIKAEVTRAVRELETGLKQYQDFVAPIRQYAELAAANGTSLDKVFANYTRLEQGLQQAPEQTIAEILQFAGITPHQYASHILGQAPDQARTQADHHINALQNRINQLESQWGGFQQAQQTREQMEAKSYIETFTRDNPRLSEPEFAKQCGQLMQARLAPDLPAAYAMVEKLNPATTPAPATPAQAAQLQPAQTRRNLSVVGAPASGSNPANRVPSSSPREAAQRALASLGIG